MALENQSTLRDYPLIFAGGDTQRINVAGNFYWIRESGDDVYVSLDGGPFVRRTETDMFQGDFSVIEIQSLVAQNVQLVAGFGYAWNNVQTVNVAVTANVTPGTQILPLADVTALAGAQTQIAAANANRLSLIAKNVSSNPIDAILRVGDNTTAAAKGVALEPGESIIIETQAAVYVWNPSGSNATVTLTENNHP